MPENVVLVGKKPVMSYVLAVVTQFGAGAKEVVVKARGRAIGKAVDISEVARRRFLAGVQVKNISIGTEQVKTKEGATSNVSTIEITLSK
jgi:DNA-binding protein